MKHDPLNEIDFGGPVALCGVQSLNATQIASPGAGVSIGGSEKVGETTTTTTKKIEYVVLPPPPVLHNHTAPYHVNQKERPAHRLMLEMAAKGYINKEIAETTGRTTVNVNNALRQPHSQQTLVNSIRDRVSADEQVVEVIRKNVVKAIETLAEIIDGGEDGKAKYSDRIAAAEALLNRRYGKPNQPINGGGSVDLNQLTDAALAKMLPSQTETTTS